MASEMSTYLQDKVVNLSLRNTAYTPPTTVYVGLFTSTVTAGGSGTEVSGGSYARTSVTFGAPSNGVTTSNADCTFPQATASWGTVSHIGLYDASTSGNLLFHTPLDTSKTIDSGDIFKIASGSLTVTLA